MRGLRHVRGHLAGRGTGEKLCDVLRRDFHLGRKHFCLLSPAESERLFNATIEPFAQIGHNLVYFYGERSNFPEHEVEP